MSKAESNTINESFGVSPEQMQRIIKGIIAERTLRYLQRRFKDDDRLKAYSTVGLRCVKKPSAK